MADCIPEIQWGVVVLPESAPRIRSSVSAYLTGTAIDLSSSNAYLSGQDSAISNTSAYLTGEILSSSSFCAYLSGSDSLVDLTFVYLEGAY